MAEKQKEPSGKWSEERLVLSIGKDLRVQMDALSQATGLSLNVLGKAAIEAFLSKQGNFRAKAVMELAQKLGVSLDQLKGIGPK